MTKVTVKLKKPLDGLPEGSETTFDKSDIEALERMGAIEVVSDEAPAPATKAEGADPVDPPAPPPPAEEKAKAKVASKAAKPIDHKAD